MFLTTMFPLRVSTLSGLTGTALRVVSIKGVGGLPVYVINRWCNPGHITVKDRICSLNIELLAVDLHTYYLPCEFSHAVVVALYIPLSANPTSACDINHSTLAELQTAHPSALIIISGDFNHVSIIKTLPKFTQYVTCKTREEKTLDLLYANVKDAYTSTSPPPLCASSEEATCDHKDSEDMVKGLL